MVVSGALFEPIATPLDPPVTCTAPAAPLVRGAPLILKPAMDAPVTPSNDTAGPGVVPLMVVTPPAGKSSNVEFQPPTMLTPLATLTVSL